MILRSIVILVAVAAGTAFALDHPRLPHRVLHVISPAQLEATCPGDFACAIPDWGKRTCHVYVPNAHRPGWPSRRQLLAHEFRHCDGRGQEPEGNREMSGLRLAPRRRSWLTSFSAMWKTSNNVGS